MSSESDVRGTPPGRDRRRTLEEAKDAVSNLTAITEILARLETLDSRQRQIERRSEIERPLPLSSISLSRLLIDPRRQSIYRLRLIDSKVNIFKDRRSDSDQRDKPYRRIDPGRTTDPGRTKLPSRLRSLDIIIFNPAQSNIGMFIRRFR